jgi:hypothetical protein
LTAATLEERYPTIAWFTQEQGWIEIGFDDNTDTFVRALDPGGMVWEGKQFYDSLDDAMNDLERSLAKWRKEELGDES